MRVFGGYLRGSCYDIERSRHRDIEREREFACVAVCCSVLQCAAVCCSIRDRVCHGSIWRMFM